MASSPLSWWASHSPPDDVARLLQQGGIVVLQPEKACRA